LLRCVQFEDSTDKIRANYRKLNAHVRKYATGQYQLQSQELLNEMARAMLCLTDEELKRDYDRSLGREVDDVDDGRRKNLGEHLKSSGKLTAEQLREAESFAEARGLDMRDAVVQLRLVDAETAGQAYAQELGLSFVDVADMLQDDAVLDQFPRNLVRRHTFIPLFVEGDRLLVACAHEPTADLEDEVRLRIGLPMRAAISTPLAINQALSKYYAPGMRETVASPEPAKGGKKKSTETKTTKGGSGAAKKAATAEARPVRTPMSQLSQGEQRQRKQLGLIIMCWSLIGSMVIDQMVLKPLLAPRWDFLLALSLVLPPIAVGWVLKSYWK